MPSSIPGFKTLLVGATGSGKTHSIRTLIEQGITPFILFTENGMGVVGDLPEDKIHWHYVKPAKADWSAMIDSAKKINTMGLDSLAKLSDINKSKHGQFIDLLTALSNFTDDRTGESFGPVDSWGTDRAIVIDSLSGVNLMAMNLVVGSKPVKSMADWGIAQDNLERLINNLCLDTRAHFILISHLERESDEVTGGIKLMASTLGKKLAPKLPRFFDDVIMCEREGSQFTWNTAAPNADLKARNLPIQAKQPATFKTIVDNWKKQGGAIAVTPATVAAQMAGAVPASAKKVDI